MLERCINIMMLIDLGTLAANARVCFCDMCSTCASVWFVHVLWVALHGFSNKASQFEGRTEGCWNRGDSLSWISLASWPLSLGNTPLQPVNDGNGSFFPGLDRRAMPWHPFDTF